MARRGFKNLALLALRECPWLLKLIRPLGAREHVMDAGGWDDEYRSGKWAYLAAISEDAHHQVVAGYAHALKPNARLLDVGCGEGTLNAALRRFGYRRYLGIDISPVAIAKAQRLADADTAFMASPGDAFATDERFDVIVFNETLNYFADPAATVAKYGRFLAEDGIFVVSMAMVGIRDGLLKLDIWRAVEQSLHVIDEMAIYRPAGATWIVKALAEPATANRLSAALI